MRPLTCFNHKIAVAASFDVRLSACGLLDCRDAVVLAHSELEIGTNLESDRQPMRRRNAGKDRAFDNYSVQLYRHNQSTGYAQSINAGCNGRNTTIIDDGRRTADERSRVSCSGCFIHRSLFGGN